MSTWPKARKRLPRQSAKQAKKNREFVAVRAEVLERDEYTCQLSRRMDGHRCAGRLHVHHIRLRAQGGTHEPSNLVTLCTTAHEYVHANPAEAALFGLLALRRPDAGEGE